MGPSLPSPKAPPHWLVQVLRLLATLLVVGVVGLGLLLVLLKNVHWATKPRDEVLDAARAAASRPAPDSTQAPGPAAR